MMNHFQNLFFFFPSELPELELGLSAAEFCFNVQSLQIRKKFFCPSKSFPKLSNSAPIYKD